MRRVYLLVGSFGFAVSLSLILVSYIFSGDDNFSAPYGLGASFIAQYYLFSLTFFVIFVVSAAMKMKSLHGGAPGKWFGLSFLSFSAGSVLGSLAFLLLVGLILSSASPSF